MPYYVSGYVLKLAKRYIEPLVVRINVASVVAHKANVALTSTKGATP